MSEMIDRATYAYENALLGGAETEAMRDAITAMREPNEAMLNAARDWSYKKYGKPIGNDAAIGCWQAMLSAACGAGQ